MFADFRLARRIEAVEASLSHEVADAVARRGDKLARTVFVRPIAGGVAVFTGESSPINKIIGVGFAALPADDELAGVERAFFERAAPVRAEVSTLADPALCAALTARGYVLEGFENVLGRALTGGAFPEVPGVDVAPTEDDATWNEVVIEGFAHPDVGLVSAPAETFPREILERIYDDMAQAGGFTRYLARIGGQAVGGAALRVSGGIGQLAGAATLPSHRRRGVQTALLNARLRDAERAGCDIAGVTTQPGSKSQENSQRRGFALLYARAILVKHDLGR